MLAPIRGTGIGAQLVRRETRCTTARVNATPRTIRGSGLPWIRSCPTGLVSLPKVGRSSRGERVRSGTAARCRGGGVHRHDYALIVGQGRSGTNWLLELLDLSSETFCRNEPYGAAESPLNRLTTHRWVDRADQSELEARWDEAVRWTCTHMGERDPAVRVRKNHLFEACRRMGVYRCVRGPRLRAALGGVLPSLRGQEWEIPRWLGSRAGLARSLPVLKLVSPPGWATFVLRHRPTTPVLHIVRHPGGFLNSWANRYLATQDAAAVLEANLARLRDVVAEDPSWAQRFGDIGMMGAEESELWYWHYANEVVFHAGSSRPDYYRIVYEELVQDPVRVMRSIYELCGLDWTDSIEAAIQRTASSSDLAFGWRSRLDRIQQSLAERFAENARHFYGPSDERSGG